MQYSVKFVKHFIVKQFKNSTHKILIFSRIEKMVWVVLFLSDAAGFFKSHFKCPKYIILKSSFARTSQMWWYGRGNSGGSWLLEEKKANMCHGSGNSGGSWPPAFPRSFSAASFWQKRERVLRGEVVDPHLKYCRLNYWLFMNYWLYELLIILAILIMTSFPVVFKQHIIYSFELLNLQFKIFILSWKNNSNNHHNSLNDQKNISKMTYI